jgi:prepilin-type N-terminal cleavage/methylation domain-containing protein
MKKGFTLVELLVTITIIGILASIGLNTFTSAQKKSRDAKRKAYLRQVVDAFEAYHNDKGEYPAADSGNIMGCKTDAEEACTWGEIFSNTTPTPNTVYMVEMPEDPSVGNTFYYNATPHPVSNLNTKFELYARLENEKDKDVPKNIDGDAQVYPETDCGNSRACNYGISSSNTTLPTPEDE